MRYESDERAIARVIEHAKRSGEVIDDGTARAIAAGYLDNDTIGFVSTGDIPQGDALGLMERIRRGVDPRALALDSEALEALCSYLLDREGSGDTGSIPGWPDKWVTRHVDYPHHDGQLPECWCYVDDDS